MQILWHWQENAIHAPETTLSVALCWTVLKWNQSTLPSPKQPSLNLLISNWMCFLTFSTMWPNQAVTAKQLEAAPECLLSVTCHSWLIPDSITWYSITHIFYDIIRAALVLVWAKYLGQTFHRHLLLQVLLWSLSAEAGGSWALNIYVGSTAVNETCWR